MLKLVKRGKKNIWWISGSIGGKRYRESTKTNSRPHAEAKLAQRQSEILDRETFGVARTLLFAEAVEFHLTKAGATLKDYELKRINKLNDHFGPWRVRDITEKAVADFASTAYPRSGPHGLDRSVYTPLIAILRRSAKARMCEMPCFLRPEKPEAGLVNPATEAELARLMPGCSERLEAAVLLMSFSGARVAEACNVEDKDVDWEARMVTLRKTKNGDPRVVPMPAIVFEAMHKLKGREGRLFGLNGRHTLNQALDRACRRTKVRVMTSHEVGRHAFAARLLGLGYTLKQVQEAGGWKSYRMVARIYGHLEKSAIHDAMRGADTKLAQIMDAGKNVVRIQTARK